MGGQTQLCRPFRSLEGRWLFVLSNRVEMPFTSEQSPISLVTVCERVCSQPSSQASTCLCMSAPHTRMTQACHQVITHQIRGELSGSGMTQGWPQSLKSHWHIQHQSCHVDQPHLRFQMPCCQCLSHLSPYEYLVL